MRVLKKIFWVCVLVFLAQCGKNTEATDNDNLFKFKNYIQYTTTGITSVVKPIRVELTNPVSTFEVNSEIPQDILKISPNVKGKLSLENSQRLVFLPEESLKPDTEYTIKVALDKLYTNVPSEFKTYTFQFKTIEPDFAINTTSIQSYDTDWQYLNGTIKTSDIVSIEKAKQLVKASQFGKDLSIKWEDFDKQNDFFNFKIDSIQRKDDDTKVIVTWNGEAIDSDKKGEDEITIPGKNNFSVLKVNVVQTPQQYVEINFSDPLQKSQNFKGLVSIENTNNLKFSVEGNILKVYTPNRLAGTLNVDIFQGIKSTTGFKLKETITKNIAFQQIKPQIRTVTNGVILPDSKNLKYNFQAVNLSAVDIRVVKIYQNNVLQFLQNHSIADQDSYNIRRVGRKILKKKIELIKSPIENDGKWKTYAIDLSELMQTEIGAIYQIEINFKKEYSLYKCAGGIDNKEESEYYDDEYYEDEYEEYENNQEELDADEREEKYWDNLIYNYKRYKSYRWEDRKDPCKAAYYDNNYNNKGIVTNLLASDIGIVVKKGEDNTCHFIVTDLMTTNPIENASITMYNYQQQEIAKANTNQEGFSVLKPKAYGYFATVQKGNSISYIRMKDGNSLSLSNFDVSGKKIKKGIKGFVYGERGVWRPGDTLHLNFILDDKLNPLPSNHPVQMQLQDPHGKITYKKVQSHGTNGFYKFDIPTNTTDETGNWLATVNVGGASFEKTIKIETIKPNRLKIDLDFDEEILSVNEPISGKIQLHWLHGAIAKNLKTNISLKLRPIKSAFKDYKKYTFYDLARSFETREMNFFEGEVNAEGFADFSRDIDLEQQAPGMLQASFLTKAYEKGGDFSINVTSKNFAPYESFVGLKNPEPNQYGSYETDKPYQFDVVSVSKDGKPKANRKLKVDIYKINWRWWWNSSEENLSNYVGSDYHQPFKSFEISTNGQGKGKFDVNIPDAKGGRYFIRVSDTESEHATGTKVYFYEHWWRTPSGANPESAKMLVFSTDKKAYNVGETATVTFPSSSEGRALISIENGSKVISTKWVKTKKGTTTTSFDITEEMTPNVFINISLIQPHAVTGNDLPMRLYGVIPITVENPKTHIYPEIEMPKSIMPEKDFTIKVKEKSGKRMTYTIAVVDEGLLDLTNFKTPNPWDEFYKREALGVKTWDIYDNVMGAYNGSVDQIFSVGGDGSLNKNKNSKDNNRFKPVSIVLGPFVLKAGETASHKIKMPNYIGSVRTMVVAGDPSKGAYGKAEETTPVKKPLMVLASIPRKLSPGENMKLPVTVFAMEKNIKNVNVSLNLSDGLKVIGDKTKQITFSKPDEKVVYFDVQVLEKEGMGNIEVLASSAGKKASYETPISIYNPNPITTKIETYDVENSQTTSIDFTPFGIEGSNEVKVQFSTIPAIDFSGRMEYLIRYPHGCVEQTTSSVFPQLFMDAIFDLNDQTKDKINENIQNGIIRLGNFQLANGGLSYWQGGTSVNEWGTNYAGHFMIEAEKRGYSLPISFLSSWLRFQKKKAQEWRPSYNRSNGDFIQAYRLYTLALAGYPDLGAMNRLREFKEISNNAKWRLAAAYALAGQKDAANQIASTANVDFETDNYRDYYTYGSRDRNRAMALETEVILGSKGQRKLSERIAKDLNSKRWMSTQTTAYCLLAIAKMVEKNGGKSMDIEYIINGNTEKLKSDKALAERSLDFKLGTNSLKVKDLKGNKVYIQLVSSGKLPLGKELVEQRNLNVNVYYGNMDGTEVNISKLSQGTEFTATLTIENLTDEYVNDIALTEIIPSGWEIVNTRFTDYENPESSKTDHIDIRDAKVNFYFSLNKNETKTFKILLNATYLGKYYLPGIQAEAMYDNEYFIHKDGQWVEVVK
ncbi:alpha-2-macroglobulin family protein [Aureivirga sp. CE67]|uniref:alpha-2-macroglobulin family protein n=1 Tax=Aureivirga sp. CE67 TaxID=1788983 RepID=UPI0018C91237|nr:MG2 domain-containing protein [Aureivirga sp. CE67]